MGRRRKPKKVVRKPPMDDSAKVRDLEKRLVDAHDQQKATAEILRIISGAPTELQPVLDAIARNAALVCDAYDVVVLLAERDRVRYAAHYGPINITLEHTTLSRGSVTETAILDRQPVHVHDLLATEPPAFPLTARAAREGGYRTTLSVPLLRENEAIGALTIRRREVQPFTAQQIALLQTFADQAVIAIENARLLSELHQKNEALTRAHAQVTEALEQQTATSEILRVISASPTDVQPVFDTICRSAVQLLDGYGASVYRFDGGLMHLGAVVSPSPEADARLRGAFPRAPDGEVAPGRSILERRVIQVPDTEIDRSARARETARHFGYRRVLAVPMIRDEDVIGTIGVAGREPRLYSEREIELLKTFAHQAVIAIENVRLFTELQASNRELEIKSRQLATASQHKSEFLANMSHELRTPLNAIIGFSEVLSARMFGDLNEKQDEYLMDIYASGQHLLSLINDILDLSKIEAGRMELELADFDLPAAIENALTLVRERAGRRGIPLTQQVVAEVGTIRADERKVKQVMLNLLSNAIKFTPEGGRIEVRANVTDGMAQVSVADTGVGIAAEDQGAIFEEFRQVGTADKKIEGTGLGLALSRKFIELHGGRIWVKSELGQGSTFTFTLPVQRGDGAPPLQ
jgi:signal transduction histidine kinase